ncbi:MAG: hypothetical protein U0354_16900 [Candidatus Sericytochromatia bacterium]
MKKVLLLLPLLLINACGQESINLSSNDNNVLSSSNNNKNQNFLKTFTVATYDINNYFQKYNHDNVKQLNLSKVIHNLKPELVALQGVSNFNEIKTFNERYLKDLNYKFYSSEDLGSQNKSVILTKFSVIETKKVSTKDNPYPTKNLFKLKLTVNPKYTFSVYTMNFRSVESPNYLQAQRDKDIEDVKKYIIANQKTNFRDKYLVLGNLNGSPTQPDLQTMVDPRSSGVSFHDVITEDFGSDNSIFSYESKTKGKSRPDYVFVSVGMFDEYIYQSVKIHNQDNKKLMQDVSEHYPVTATFNLPE